MIKQFDKLKSSIRCRNCNKPYPTPLDAINCPCVKKVKWGTPHAINSKTVTKKDWEEFLKADSKKHLKLIREGKRKTDGKEV